MTYYIYISTFSFDSIGEKKNIAARKRGASHYRGEVVETRWVQTRGPNPEGPGKIKIQSGLETNERRRCCGDCARNQRGT
jgi:hypothetical protein